MALTGAEKAARYRARYPEKVGLWQKLNPDKVREKMLRYRERNRAKVLERQRLANKEWRTDPIKRERLRISKQASYQRHKAKCDAKNRAWNERNRDRALFTKRLRERRRIDKKRSAAGKCSWDKWLSRILFYGWCCAYCRTALTLKTVEVDHRIPISRGGSNWPANLVPCCASCNSSKRDMMPSEFLNRRTQKCR